MAAFCNQIAFSSRLVRCSHGSSSMVAGSAAISCKRNMAVAPARKSTSEYCMDLVKQHDYENFLCCLLLPGESRLSSMAIRAFNVEVAQVRDQVSEHTIGLMRMKFWRDTLDKIYAGDPPKQPMALELQRALKRHKLSKRWFQRLIDSREQHLTDDAFESISTLESYAENSTSSVLYLVLETLSIKNVQADHAVSHLGKAQGLTNIVRGIAHNARKRRVYLPQDVMLKHSLSQEDIIRGSSEQKVADVVFEVASLAQQHLQKARLLMLECPKEARVAMLPGVATELYLNRLQKVNFDPFHSSLAGRSNFLPLHLWWKKMRKTI